MMLEAKEAELGRLVESHRVCWEVRPQEHLREERGRVQVGYILALSGVHDHPDREPVAGCEECRLVHRDLRRIAQWIMPKEERESRYEIEVFDSSLHYTPRRSLREEVVLCLRILHRGQWDAPVDSCEIRCLREMEDALRRLGARKGTWQS